VKLAEVCQLLDQSHLGIQPTLLGHIPDALARREVERHPIPSHLALIGREDAEHYPHHGGLARTVAANKAEELAGADIEAQVLQGDRVPVTFRDPIDLETAISAHVSSDGTAAGSCVQFKGFDSVISLTAGPL
jgi:hypothetical protein